MAGMTKGIGGRAAVGALALAALLSLGACSGSDDDGDGASPQGGGAGDDAGDGTPSAADALGNGVGGAMTDAPVVAPPPGTLYATAPGIEECSTDDVKARVDFDMRDYYVFASQVPSLSPAEFDTPEEQIRALRVAPDTFSSVSDFEDFQAQTAGRTTGFGFRLQEDESGRPRFRLVIGGSPAAAAGLERGDVLEALDGESVDGLDAEEITGRLRDAEDGQTVTFGVRRGDASLDIDVTRSAYTIDTIAGTFAFDAGDGTRVGYVPVLQFADTTAGALDGAFRFLVDEGVEALVVDLRYNPGGLIFAANRLGAHVAGGAVAGETFVQYLFNERYAREENFAVPFEDVGNAALGLERVVVIGTEESASSSELFINGLRPFVDVELVGTTTFGKAFGSSPERYCDKAINAMRFITANAEDATVAGGLEPGCTVEDDWNAPLGDPDDALTDAAYGVLLDGVCRGDVQASAAARARPAAIGRTLWDETPRPPGAY